MNIRKKLPVGVENFRDLRLQNFYYIDKSELIKDILESWSTVHLFTRPRRFGKSLNMYMLRDFFSIGTDKTLFDGLEISKYPQICEDYMARFPVIFITLKNISARSFENALEKMGDVIKDEARRHQYLLDSDKLTDIDKKAIAPLYEDQIALQKQWGSLKVLSEMLYKHFGQKPIILIDEYDVPLDKAYVNGYYDEMVEHIRSIFEMALKSNEYMYFAVLTGCLRINMDAPSSLGSKRPRQVSEVGFPTKLEKTSLSSQCQSIFTGLNNFSVHTISDTMYAKYFGFTDGEVQMLLSDYAMSCQYETVRTWYDGYRFGKTEVYCPWDVICYVKDYLSDPDIQPKKYWINTSENAIVKNLIHRASRRTKDEIERLITGESITKVIQEELTYKDLDSTIENLWSLLYTTGYLTVAETSDGSKFALTIPNREIHEIFVLQVQTWFKDVVIKKYPERLKRLCSAFKNGDAGKIQELFTEYLKQTISIRDTFVAKDRKENFYHGILLGLLSSEEDWLIQSNPEAGDGYCDIRIEMDDTTGCIIEVKYAENRVYDEACAEALAQIDRMNYVEELTAGGLSCVYKYAVACYKKGCQVVCEKVKQ